jgi:glucose uptake protein GlcU
MSFAGIIIFILSVIGVVVSSMGLKKYTDKTKMSYKFLLFATILFALLTGGLFFYGGYKMIQSTPQVASEQNALMKSMGYVPAAPIVNAAKI